MLAKTVKILCDNLRRKSLDISALRDFMDTAGISEYGHAILFLQEYGLPLVVNESRIFLKTSHTLINEQIFCFVDIETNGPKANEHQVIEIGAVLVKNSEIIDTMQVLVKCTDVSEQIFEITGLNTEMLKNGESEISVLRNFSIFLKDAVFIAHNVGFDFSFISKRMEKLGIGFMFNRRMCTVELAKRTIDAPKYGLKSLSEHFNLKNQSCHRALPDALASKEIFDICVQNLQNLTVEELILFSEQAPALSSKKGECSV